jgi:hypothetical protein
MEVGHDLYSLVASLWERTRSNYQIGDWVGPRAELDAFEKIKISCLFWEWNSNSCV